MSDTHTLQMVTVYVYLQNKFSSDCSAFGGNINGEVEGIDQLGIGAQVWN